MGQCVNSTRVALTKEDGREGGAKQTFGWYYMPAVYAPALEDLLSSNRQLMPGEAEEELGKKLEIDLTQKPVEFPPAYKIKQKVSSLKQKMKGMGERST